MPVWVPIALGIMAVVIILLIGIVWITDSRMDGLESRLWDMENEFASLLVSLSWTIEPKSTDSPEQQHGSVEIDDTGAYGGAATSADYWSHQERDMDTDSVPFHLQPHDFTGRSDRDCERCGFPDRADIHRTNGASSWYAKPHHCDVNIPGHNHASSYVMPDGTSHCYDCVETPALHREQISG